MSPDVIPHDGKQVVAAAKDQAFTLAILAATKLDCLLHDFRPGGMDTAFVEFWEAFRALHMFTSGERMLIEKYPDLLVKTGSWFQHHDRTPLHYANGIKMFDEYRESLIKTGLIVVVRK